MPKRVGKKIATLRHERGMSQTELAQKARITRGYVSQLERAMKSPTLEVFFRIAKALHCDPRDMLTFNGH